MQTKKSTLFKYNAILIMLATALLASCENLISRTPNDAVWGGDEQGENSASGALTVTARVSNGSSRHAMPSVAVSDFIYAALLYTDDNKNENFAQAETADGGKLKFSFQRPDDTNGTFTLEIFAFVKTEGGETPQFSRGAALLSGGEGGLAIDGDAIEVKEAIALAISSDKPGTVSLKIKVPADCSLEINDTANFNCEKDESSSDTYILTQVGDGISASAYQVTFTVKKDSENWEIIHIFSEHINVINGLCTDTWSGLAKGAAKDVSNGMSKTVYVRGTGGWYDGSEYNATASDENSGSFLAPFATIQKAVDTVIARNTADLESNDGEPVEPYTIFVDGTLKCDENTYIGTYGMADFSALEKNLTLTIKALSGTATLDGGAVFGADGTVETAGIDRRIIYARPGTNGKLDLTLENLVITGGSKGGIYVYGNNKLTMSDCEISRCTNDSGSGVGVSVGTSSTFTMKSGTISDNIASTYYGGGVYVGGGTFTMEGGSITSNTAIDGGGVYVYSGTFTMEGGTISDNTTSCDGGGVYVISSGKFTMSGGTISDCTVTDQGGGVYIASSATFEMSGTAKITGCKTTSTSSSSGGGGIYNFGSLSITGGMISGCTSATRGGGVYIRGGTFTMEGGMISGNNATSDDGATDTRGGGVYVGANGKFEMIGGMISDNTSDTYGGGVYTLAGLSLSGDGAISNNTSVYGGGIYVSNNTFTMSDNSTISHNEATGNGGGVFVNAFIDGNTGDINKAEFEMSGGTISGNTAVNRGGGVYICGDTKNEVTVIGAFMMSGAAKVAENNDVYLYATTPTITVAGALTAESPVATITPSTYKANRKVLSAGENVTLDGSICNKFDVTPQSDGTEWRCALDGADGVLIRKYALGDTGPGGGAVCYYDSNGFTVNGKTCHYLECSKDPVGTTSWCPCTFSGGWCDVTTSAVIGAGYENTQSILAHPKHASATAANCAAKACAEYSTSTTTAGEWFLPSNNEVNKINKGVAIISSESIWSSRSEYSNTAHCVNLQSNGSNSLNTNKSNARVVRAMRAF